MSEAAPEVDGWSREEESDPRTERHWLRIALLHAWSLAAAYEGRGRSAPTGSSADDAKCLRHVMELLLAHRQKQLLAVKLISAVEVVEILVPIYQRYLRDAKMTEAHLQAALEASAATHQLSFPAELLARLVVKREAFRATRFHKQGAVETARYLVGSWFGISGSQIAKHKPSRRLPTRYFGTAFERAVSTGAAATYARQVLEWTPPADSPHHAAWSAIRGAETQQRASIASQVALFPALIQKVVGAIPVDTPWPVAAGVHPVLQGHVERTLEEGILDDRWDPEKLRAKTAADLQRFIVRELALFDGIAAPPLTDAPAPPAPTDDSNASSRGASRRAKGVTAARKKRR